METEYVTKDTFDANVKRFEDEERRQNNRIKGLEDEMKVLHELTLSVGKMAVNLDAMSKELTKQGQRLEAIESMPGSRWNSMVSALIGAVAAAIGAGIIAAVINFL